MINVLSKAGESYAATMRMTIVAPIVGAGFSQTLLLGMG